jgi:hypothetical protein
MTLSLAFLSPTIVQAIVEGRLPRGIGLTPMAKRPKIIGRISACSSSHQDPRFQAAMDPDMKSLRR